MKNEFSLSTFFLEGLLAILGGLRRSWERKETDVHLCLKVKCWRLTYCQKLRVDNWKMFGKFLWRERLNWECRKMKSFLRRGLPSPPHFFPNFSIIKLDIILIFWLLAEAILVKPFQLCIHLLNCYFYWLCCHNSVV